MLYDRVDEWLVAALTEFDGKPLRSVARGDLDLGGIHQTDETAQEQLEEEFREFVARVRSILGERVGDVRLSQRLKDSPACVIAPEGALGRRLERLLREVGQDVPGSKPILELNPSHPIVLKARHDDDKERFKQWCHLLLDQAILAEGGELEDPAGFVQRLNELLVAIAG